MGGRSSASGGLCDRANRAGLGRGGDRETKLTKHLSP